jgi:hypothetical protein
MERSELGNPEKGAKDIYPEAPIFFKLTLRGVLHYNFPHTRIYADEGRLPTVRQGSTRIEFYLHFLTQSPSALMCVKSARIRV